MSTDAESSGRSPLAPILAVLVALGLARATGRFLGLFALLGVVVATVLVFTVGIAVLRLALLL